MEDDAQAAIRWARRRRYRRWPLDRWNDLDQNPGRRSAAVDLRWHLPDLRPHLWAAADGTATISNSPISVRNCLTRRRYTSITGARTKRPRSSTLVSTRRPFRTPSCADSLAATISLITTCLKLPPISGALERCVVSLERPVPK